MACRLAIWPTRRSPSSVNPTTDGVVRLPSRLGITCGVATSTTATHEFVVPRSIPMIFGMVEIVTAGRCVCSALALGPANRNLHQRRPEQAVVKEIHLLQNGHDGMGRHGGI